MRYEEFISSVAQRTGLFEGDAVALTRATLTTLAERISGDEACDLVGRLPFPLQDAAPGERRGPKRSASMSSSTEWLNAADVTRQCPKRRVAVVADPSRRGDIRQFEAVVSPLTKVFQRLCGRRPGSGAAARDRWQERLTRSRRPIRSESS